MGNCLRLFYRLSDSLDDVRTTANRRASTHPPAWYLDNDPILHPEPGLSIPFSQLTEDQQIKIATRLALIATLPVYKFDANEFEKCQECVICMCDYENGEEVRRMPMCPHVFHRVCIDDWLTRSLTCPSCLQEIPPPPGVATASPRQSRERQTSADAAGETRRRTARGRPANHGRSEPSTTSSSNRGPGSSMASPPASTTHPPTPSSPGDSVDAEEASSHRQSQARTHSQRDEES